DETFEPVLLDFGIAKHLRSRTMTQNDQLWGTPAYMSPEQASGESVAGTADIYAMGVMLYELIAGVLPFRASTAMGFAVKHMHREADPIRSLPGIRDVPQRLESFILHMLEKDPADRPPTMARVADELRAIQQQDFDERLLGTVPSRQVQHEQLEEPSDDEAAVAPGEMSAEIDESLRGAETALLDSPPDSAPPPDSSVSAPAPDASRGSEFETDPTEEMGWSGGDMKPWFQRPVVLGGVVLLATMVSVGGYLSFDRRAGSSTAPETTPKTAVSDEPTGSEQSDQSDQSDQMDQT
ncbi:MAG: protein kinase, partial [Bradymonadaceae bacterium]